MNDELSERQAADDEMLPEYDFSGGVRGKHYQAYQRGYVNNVESAATLQQYLRKSNVWQESIRNPRAFSRCLSESVGKLAKFRRTNMETVAYTYSQGTVGELGFLGMRLHKNALLVK